ncbi:MAG: CpaF family protein [Anaerolineae bacterium]
MTVLRGLQRGNRNDLTADKSQPYADIRQRVQRRLLSELSPSIESNNLPEVRRALEQIFNEIVSEEQLPLSRTERSSLFEDIIASILGFGAIDPLLHDDSVSEILVNGPDQVYIERNGRLEETDLHFRDASEVLRIIERIVAPLGRRVDESSPMVDARLADGSRVNVIIPPLSLVGPCISIRKFPQSALTMEDYLRLNTLSADMGTFLKACVEARLNIIISGGTSTGKTTFLNVLSGYIPSHERIVTIEDAAELRLHQRHVVRLESRPANIEGKGQVAIRQLVSNALRMRPDRIVVGEVRGAEALDMLQAMNTGHDGSMTTAHANTTRDALRRIETMVLMAGMDLPLRAVREQISSAFNLVAQLTRMSDGTRKITALSEVQGMEGDIVVMQDIFRYVQTGVHEGKVEGQFSATGVRPRFCDRIEAIGIILPASMFTPATKIAKR